MGTGAERRPGGLLKGLIRAPIYSLRTILLALTLVALGYAAWSPVAGEHGWRGAAGGVAVAVIPALAALAAQWVAERTGAVGREDRRRQAQRAEMESWPRWKRIAFLFLGLGVLVTLVLLRLWGDWY